MAGYSSTPLPQKLGIKPGSIVHILGEPRAELPFVATSAAPPADVLLAFVTREAELDLPTWGAAIRKDGVLWVCWPKKTARKQVPSDMTEDLVRAQALPLGLVDNKVCAIDEVWSGLRLVWRVALRGTPR